MTSLAEKITDTKRPHFDFKVDSSVSRIREHALALDRCKRYTEVPRFSFQCGLKPIEWAVFAYYYSLAPCDHPSELLASTHLKIGRKTLAATLRSLSTKGLVFFDTHVSSRLKIINLAHPVFWGSNGTGQINGPWTDPATHQPRRLLALPERINEARDYSHIPGNHVRLPYLLFQTLIHPTSKFLYGLLCFLDVNTHPTVKEFATALHCSAPTVALHIAELEEYRMIYSETREPVRFGEHTRYFHHLTDVALWKTRKAELWYPGGENSLIVRLDKRGSSAIDQRAGHDLEDYRPQPDRSQVVAWPLVSQETSGIRQEMSGIRRDVECAEQVRLTTSEHRQETSQIRQDELRQTTLQLRQMQPQLRQMQPQLRQIRCGLIENMASNHCPSTASEDSNFANNTNITGESGILTRLEPLKECAGGIHFRS
jgi:hypothetical protein